MEERNGWHRALMAAKQFDVTVFYSPKTVPVDLDLAVPDELKSHVKFIAIELRGIYRWMLRREAWFYIAYRQWHRQVYHVARRMHEKTAFDLTHLVTLCGFREPGYAWKLNIPNVWGPIGGSHDFPIRMLRILDLRSRLRELTRSAINHYQLFYSGRIRQAASCSIVLAATKSSAQELERGLGIRTQVDLETGIDYEIAPLREARDTRQPLRILWAGRLRGWKGLPLLLQALAQLPDSIKYELRVLGDGDCKQRWQRLAEQLGVHQHIQWIAWPNYRETLQHYQWADTFAFTSQRDTSGTGLVESLAAGCPLIAVNHQGVADLLEHHCGVAVDMASYQTAVDGFAKAIESYATSSELWLEKSHAASRLAGKLHWSGRSEWMLDVYQEALDKDQKLVQAKSTSVEPLPSSEGRKLSGFLALGDQGITSLTNFMTILLLARSCDDSVFAAIALAAQFINYSRSALERLLSTAYGALVHRVPNRVAFTGSSAAHSAIFTTLVTCLALLCALLFWSFTDAKTLGWGLVTQCMLLPCIMLRDHFRSLCLSNLQVGFVFILDLIASIVQLGLLGLLIYQRQTDSLSISLAWTFANALFLALWFFKRPLELKIDRESVRTDWQSSWGYSRWLVLGRCLGIASYLFVPWVLTAIHGDQPWALFAKAMNLVGLSVLFVTGLNNYFQPLTITTLHSRGLDAMKQLIARSLWVYVLVLSGLCFVYAAFGYQMMEFLYSTDQVEQGWLLTLLGLNVLTFSVAVIASNGLAAMKMSLASFWGELANFCVAAAVAIPLILWLGTLGAALSISLGSLAATVVTVMILRQKLLQASVLQS